MAQVADDNYMIGILVEVYITIYLFIKILIMSHKSATHATA